MTTVVERINANGISIPEVSAPAANYAPAKIIGAMLFVSGQIPRMDGELVHCGVVGDDVSVEQAREAARICALNVIGQVKARLDGDLDRVKECVRVRGFVNATPDFARHADVIDAASDVFVEVFGDVGRHVRTAIGAGSLPRNVSVEIDADFQITT